MVKVIEFPRPAQESEDMRTALTDLQMAVDELLELGMLPEDITDEVQSLLDTADDDED